MDVGMIGLGKLGLPVAVAIANRGHRVYGYDLSRETVERHRSGVSGLYEPMIDSHLRTALEDESLVLCDSVKEVVERAELIFIAVQTPHAPELDGTQRYDVTKDFDYSFLVEACRQVAVAIPPDSRDRAIAIISTVLPGTTRGLLLPAMMEMEAGVRKYQAPWDIYYNPSFVAMGQVEWDFLRPEFALIGTEKPGEAPTALLEFYTSIHHAPFHVMTWEEAELTKVCYNTFIGWKIATANTVMQMCEELGDLDCDAVLGALQSATNRIVSGRYMRGGLGDGGPCVVPGTRILTREGLRPIERLSVGDDVMGHDGQYHAIRDTMVRTYNGPLITFGAWGKRLAVTPEHPVWVLRLAGKHVTHRFVPAEQMMSTEVLAVPPQAFPDWELLGNVQIVHQEIEALSSEPYAGDVYNLAVEGCESYVTQAGVLHNCHPRDALAMASLSDRMGLKYNIFDFIMRTRESQAEWIADIMCRWPHKKVILGKTFKPLTNLTAGSPSILIGNILLERGAQVEYKDPVLTPHAMEAASEAAVYLVGTSDPSWSKWIATAGVAPGSVVVDPWGLIGDAPEGVEIFRVGRR